MKSFIATLVVVICFITAMVFSVKNTAIVNINYFIAQSDFNISHVIGLAFLTGFVICWRIFYSMYIALKLKLRFANRTIAKLSNQQASAEPVKEKSISHNV